MKWTPRQDAIIISCVEQGMETVHIAEKLGTTVLSIKHRRAILIAQGKLERTHPGFGGRPVWTAEEDRIIIKAAAADHAYETTAAVLGRSWRAIKARRNRLVAIGKIPPRKTGHPRGWKGHAKGGSRKPKGVSTMIGDRIDMVISPFEKGPDGVLVRTVRAA